MGGFGPVARFKYLSAFAAGDLFSLSSEFDSHCLFGFWPSRFATEEQNHLLRSGIIAGGREAGTQNYNDVFSGKLVRSPQ